MHFCGVSLQNMCTAPKREAHFFKHPHNSCDSTIVACSTRCRSDRPSQCTALFTVRHSLPSGKLRHGILGALQMGSKTKNVQITRAPAGRKFQNTKIKGFCKKRGIPRYIRKFGLELAQIHVAGWLDYYFDYAVRRQAKKYTFHGVCFRSPASEERRIFSMGCAWGQT